MGAKTEAKQKYAKFWFTRESQIMGDLEADDYFEALVELRKKHPTGSFMIHSRAKHGYAQATTETIEEWTAARLERKEQATLEAPIRPWKEALYEVDQALSGLKDAPECESIRVMLRAYRHRCETEIEQFERKTKAPES